VNLTERLGEKRILWCPFSEAGACVIKNADGESVREPNECAHYNPETDECVHVEAARAQIRIAKELSVIDKHWSARLSISVGGGDTDD